MLTVEADERKRVRVSVAFGKVNGDIYIYIHCNDKGRENAIMQPLKLIDDQIVI